MWVEGKIKSYITERGFGFISMGGAAKDLFFHVRDLPNKDVEPKLGEQLKFQILEDNGKLKADQIVRLDLKPEGANLSHSFKQMHSRRNASPRFNKRSATGLILDRKSVV